MIFILDTIESFLSCIGKGTVFITPSNGSGKLSLTRSEDSSWMLSGVAYISRNPATPPCSAYCSVTLEDDFDIAEFKSLFTSWKVFSGIVGHTFKDVDEIFSIPNDRCAISKEQVQEAIAIAQDTIQVELQRVDKKEEMELLKKMQDMNAQSSTKMSITSPMSDAIKKNPPINPNNCSVVPPMNNKSSGNDSLA